MLSSLFPRNEKSKQHIQSRIQAFYSPDFFAQRIHIVFCQRGLLTPQDISDIEEKAEGEAYLCSRYDMTYCQVILCNLQLTIDISYVKR